MSARFSAIVRPVTVRTSPCSRPASSSAFITTGTPPTRSTSVITYRPNGLTSARCGTRVADPVEVVERQVDLGLVRDGEQVQHRVGGAAERHHHGDRVLERLPGQDLSRAVMPWRSMLDHGLAGAPGEAVAAAVGRRRRGRAGQRHAQRLGRAGHRVRGVHAAAGALAGADRALDRVDVLAAHQPAGAGADRLERVDDRDLALGAVGQLGDARAGSSPA